MKRELSFSMRLLIRLVRTLEELKETLGNRRMTLCRELTKRHETAFHTTIEELILYYQTEKPLGECVLVIEGRSRQEMEEEQKASWRKNYHRRTHGNL